MLAISRTTYRRMVRAYARNPDTIIHPPADTDKFTPGDDEPQDYFLIVSSLNPYKRVDVAVEACNRLGLPLKVVGDGQEFDRLSEMAGPTVEMVGRVPDDEIVDYYRRCRAFIMPQIEDFGLTPLEANACGRPVVALRDGGATETMIEGETCRFFDDQTAEALADALDTLDDHAYNPEVCRENALRFSTERFKQELGDYVERCVQEQTGGG
jgi:glycosyltransferase involved in cell wall biosynthesis